MSTGKRTLEHSGSVIYFSLTHVIIKSRNKFKLMEKVME